MNQEVQGLKPDEYLTKSYIVAFIKESNCFKYASPSKMTIHSPNYNLNISLKIGIFMKSNDRRTTDTDTNR